MLFSFQRPSALIGAPPEWEEKSLSDGEAHLLPPLEGRLSVWGLSVVRSLRSFPPWRATNQYINGRVP
jgi:hypothetical protein